MMPVQETNSGQTTSQDPNPQLHTAGGMAAAQGESINYKKKYKVLKRKMRMLVYEQECFMEELKKAQRKLLKVSRDRSFLLDRLLQHEKLDDTSDDTDITASSDSDAAEGTKDVSAAKKKKLQNQTALTLSGSSVSLLSGNLNKQQASWLLQMSGDKSVKAEPGTKRKAARVGKKTGRGGAVTITTDAHGQSGTGHMTREELERHLELKQSAKPQFMSLETAPYSLPEDIFSHDNSNQDGYVAEKHQK